jgi:hypothetical protein
MELHGLPPAAYCDNNNNSNSNNNNHPHYNSSSSNSSSNCDHLFNSLSGQYAPVHSDFNFYAMINGFAMPSSMPLSLQHHSDFQGMSGLAEPQLFRDSDGNTGMATQTTQSSESRQNFASLQQMQAAMSRSQPAPDIHAPTSPAHLSNISPLLSKKAEEPDSACRPRLTPEQTQFLEEIFSHTPRPTTQQKKKHANQLGLTHEKVNVRSLCVFSSYAVR